MLKAVEPYRRTLLRLAVLCNVIGAVLLFFFVLSLQGPREPQNRSHSLRAWIAQRLAPAPAPAAPSGGTYVYGPFLPPGLNPPAEAPAPPQPERPAPAPVSAGSLLPGLRLPQVFPLVPRQISPLPVGSGSTGSAGVSVRGTPSALRVTLPAHLFADSQQASEVALLLGEQLSQQGYLATVVVTDQEESPAITVPSGAEAEGGPPIPAAAPGRPSPLPPPEFSSRARPLWAEGRGPDSAREAPGPGIREVAGGTGPEMASIGPTDFPRVPDREPEKHPLSRMAASALAGLAEPSSSPPPVSGKPVRWGPARLAEPRRAEALRTVQVTLPLRHFADPGRVAEVATSLGQQLSRQGYLTTVKVTDQARFASAPLPRAFRPGGAAGPVPVLSETASPSVRIAQGWPNPLQERRWESRAGTPSPAAAGGEARKAQAVAWEPSWPPTFRAGPSPTPALERPKVVLRRQPSSQSEEAPEAGEPLRIAARELPIHLPGSGARPRPEIGRRAPGGAEQGVASAASPSSADRSPKLEGQVVQVAQALNGNGPFSPRPHLRKEASPELPALEAGTLASGERESASDQRAVKLAALRLVRAWQRAKAVPALPSPGSPLPARSPALESAAPQVALTASPDLSESKAKAGPEKRAVRIAAAAAGWPSEAAVGLERKPAAGTSRPIPGFLAEIPRPSPAGMASRALPSAASPVEGAGHRSFEAGPGVSLWETLWSPPSLAPPSPTAVQVARAPVRRPPSGDAPADSQGGTAAVAVAPAEPPSPPVRIAWAPGNTGMPQPPSGLPWEIPRDAPPPVWGSWLEVGDPIALAGRQSVRAAAMRLVEGWRRLRDGGLPTVPPLAVASSDRHRAGSEALLVGPPATVPVPFLPVPEPAFRKSRRSPLPGEGSQGRGFPSAYQVIPAFGVQLLPFRSREEAWPHCLRLQEQGFPIHLRDLAAMGQAKAIVWAGPYPDAAAAEACRNALGGQGYQATVQPSLSFLPLGPGTVGRYAVQVVCLQEGLQAQRVAEALAADGLPAFRNRDPQSALWRVYVGPLAGREAAQQVAQHLSLAGYPTWVVSWD